MKPFGALSIKAQWTAFFFLLQPAAQWGRDENWQRNAHTLQRAHHGSRPSWCSQEFSTPLKLPLLSADSGGHHLIAIRKIFFPLNERLFAYLPFPPFFSSFFVDSHCGLMYRDTLLIFDHTRNPREQQTAEWKDVSVYFPRALRPLAASSPSHLRAGWLKFHITIQLISFPEMIHIAL